MDGHTDGHSGRNLLNVMIKVLKLILLEFKFYLNEQPKFVLPHGLRNLEPKT